MQADRYSQTIAFLKVILPLMALALLSTLFLISRVVTPTATIPFADNEIRERLANQQVTGPYFSGTSARGDQIAFISEKLTSPGGAVGMSEATDVIVDVTLASGVQIMIESDLARVDIANDQSELTGAVEIVTSHGYELQSDKLLVTMSDMELRSPGAVRGTTPVGDIEAGSMELSVPRDTGNAQLIFTNGVKLLYQRNEAKE